MAKKRKSVSLEQDVYDYSTSVENFSEKVEKLVRQEMMAEQQTAEERLQSRIEEEEEAIEDLRDDLEEREAEVEKLKAKLDRIQAEKKEALYDLLDEAAKYVALEPRQREFREKNTGTIAGYPAGEVFSMFDDVLPDHPKDQARLLGVFDDVQGAGNGPMTDWQADEAVEAVSELSNEQKDAIEEWWADEDE